MQSIIYVDGGLITRKTQTFLDIQTDRIKRSLKELQPSIPG